MRKRSKLRVVRIHLRLVWRKITRKKPGKIDQNAPCPACGHRQGRIEFRLEDRAIAHQCLVCRAEWGEETIITPEKWL